MFQIAGYPQLTPPPATGRLGEDCAAFLSANGKAATAEHCRRVAECARELARRFGVDAPRAVAAAWLHDIAAVLGPQRMLDYARAEGWTLDPAEEAHPFLLHQRVAVDMAPALFGVGEAKILSAIGCHTTLKSNASPVDMALFLADKLAWDQPGDPPYLDAVQEALTRSLAHGCLAYIEYVMDHGMILSPHQWLLEARAWLRGICGR